MAGHAQRDRKVRVFLIGPVRSQEDFVFQAVSGTAQILSAVGLLLSIRRGDTNVGGSVREAIRDSDIVVADLTGVSPNVFWEVGYAQALEKSVVLITRDLSAVPFDLRQQRVILYDSSEPSFLTSRFVETFQEIVRGNWSQGGPSMQNRRERVMVSYSHADTSFLQRVLVHLRPLERDGLIDLWADTKLVAGDQWRDEIRHAVSDARVAILLISADFLASAFITTNELPPLLSAAEDRGTRIIPVIVKPSRFLRDPRLARFQAINDPTTPLIAIDEAAREWVYAKLADIVEADLARHA